MVFLIPNSPLIKLTNSNPIGALILVVINAILEVFFLCLVGWILAKKGIVDDKAKKVLNKLNVSLFTPALLFSKVAFSLSPKLLKELAIIPCGFIICTCLSAGVAFLMANLFKLKKGQKSFAIACAMFQNSNSLPIALMQSLIGEKMPLMWGDDDSKDQMLGRALSYLVLFSTLGIIVRWSIGVRLLTSAETDPISSSSEEEDEEDEEDNEREEGLVSEPEELEEGESRYFSTSSTSNGISGSGGSGETSTLLGGDEVPINSTLRNPNKKKKSLKKSTSFASTTISTSPSNNYTNNNNNDMNSNLISSLSSSNSNPTNTAEEYLTASQIEVLDAIKAGGVLGGVRIDPTKPHRQTSRSRSRSQSQSQSQSKRKNSKLLSSGGGGGGKSSSSTGHYDRTRPQSIFQSFPNTPMPKHRLNQYNSSEEDDQEGDEEGVENHENDPEWGINRSTTAIGGHHIIREEDNNWFFLSELWNDRFKRLGRRIKKVWKPFGKFFRRVGDFMTVPLWAALLSLTVACIPPLQRTLNEVEPLKAALKNAGNCSVPITLVTLGAYFYRPSIPHHSIQSSSSLASSSTLSPSSPYLPPSTPNKKKSFFSKLNPFSKKPSSSSLSRPNSIQLKELKERRNKRVEGETRTVLVAVITRMILVPLMLIPLLGWYCAYTNNVADDPIFVVVACLLIGSPTAITLAQITSSASGEVFEILISRTLFVSYAIMTAPCTIALVLAGLYIDGKQ